MAASDVCFCCKALALRPTADLGTRYYWAANCSCGAIDPLFVRDLRARINEVTEKQHGSQN